MKRISVVVVIVLFGVIASSEAKAQGPKARSNSGDPSAVRRDQSRRREV